MGVPLAGVPLAEVPLAGVPVAGVPLAEACAALHTTLPEADERVAEARRALEIVPCVTMADVLRHAFQGGYDVVGEPAGTRAKM